jgi:ribosomal protein S18 acetylase RimI-like enzyme
MKIRELQPSEISEAADLLSRGMNDNPINVAAFGSDAGRRQAALARFFRAAMQGTFKRGKLVGAFSDDAMLGICGMTPPGKCQAEMVEKLRMLPVLLGGNAPRVFTRVLSWVGAWARLDPAEPHWHLGPVAVDANLRGMGIGGALVADFCARVDAAGSIAYLETDKKENVAFYEKFGFVVTTESSVLGVPNWFMTRRAG